MVSLDRALKLVLANSSPLPKVRVQLEDSVNCFLAEPVIAKFDSPRFDNSEVDGYGIMLQDIKGASARSPKRLEVIRTIRAGGSPGANVRSGHAVKIFTGTPVPAGIEAILMREEIDERHGQQIIVTHNGVPGQHIRRRASEHRKGETLLPSGTQITPSVVGLLASLGLRDCSVYDRPVVCIVVTGDEILPAGAQLRTGCSYDSISPSLSAWCAGLGIVDCNTLRCEDNPTDTTQTLRSALKQADVVLTVGGISMGDYDLVDDALAYLGVQTHFAGVAIKPGKPAYFGTSRRKSKAARLVFGLPGNPVSALVVFHLFVRPALAVMMGAPQTMPSRFFAALTSDLHKTHGRYELVRGRAEIKKGKWKVSPVQGQESYMLGGLARANCLIHFPSDSHHLRAGRPALIEPFSFE